MKKIRTAVLFGGCSVEYDVSLKSAYAVITHMHPDKYETLMIGITREGRWLRYFGDPAKIPTDLWHTDRAHCVPVLISPERHKHAVIEFDSHGVIERKIDIVFPVLHGKNGEDGTIQGLIELAGIPLAGCGTLSSALCMDKDKAHKLAEVAGVKTPLSIIASQVCTENQISKQAEAIKYPLFVKPVCSGSSFGITKVYSPENLLPAVREAFLYDQQVIIEESIDGFEVGCAILGNQDLIIGEVDEIEVASGFFDYTEKYTLKSSKIHMPARIDAKTALRVKETAGVIYRALGCRGAARVDMFVTPGKEIVFNEVNTIPGYTVNSRYPAMMKGIGLQFAEIVDKVIQCGLKK